ncbi:MAG: tetratricopeptide repeat protein [Bacteroidales bacterium]|nr:tetratricopeptide repeat protein [Bacteroidales bacterium]
MKRFWESSDFEEINPLVERFEASLYRGEPAYFDSDEFLDIIETYLMYDYSKAAYVLDLAMSRFPSNTQLTLKLAILEAHRGNFAEAHGVIRSIQALGVDRVEVYHAKALIYSKELRIDEAIKSLKQALNYDSDNIEAVFDIIENYMLLKDYPAVIKWSKIYLDKVFDGEILERISEAFKKSDDDVSAVEFFSQYADKYPLKHFVWMYLARAYSRLGMYEKSLEAYDFGISIVSYSASLVVEMSDVYVKMGQIDNALDLLESASIEPNYSEEISVALGKVYLLKNNYKEAQRHILHAMYLNADMAEPWGLMAKIYYVQKDYLNAYHCVFKYFMSLGVANEDEYEISGAYEYVVLAKSLDVSVSDLDRFLHDIVIEFPEILEFAVEYADFLFKNDNIKKAIEVLLKALEEDVKEPVLGLYRLAAYYYYENEIEQGNTALITALTVDYSKKDYFIDYATDLMMRSEVIEIFTDFSELNL